VPIPTDLKQLTDLFRRIGADRPDEWATSQVTEGINQLHRYMFLRQMWRCVIDENDHKWIDKFVNEAVQRPHDPYAGIGHALARLLSCGARREDLVDVVRGMQALVLSEFCYVLDDPSIEERELADLGWSLVETTPDFAPTRNIIGGLHESVLETDPTGREMRPRNAS
jgi:hypothetical protein